MPMKAQETQKERGNEKLYEPETAYKESTKPELSYMQRYKNEMLVETKSKLASRLLLYDKLKKRRKQLI